ncbi:Putative SWI/SNF-related matrix-associated actin-dependent regulator of chromatin subfamily A member 3-like 1 [Dendrobium catenatum]|uniref:SWI/SNF-related matrix-associated actin-dependent regulator of chromatin subfamily A member 3-like 1 n=1 Tax=Dendrobium catenatum TaxID=906689 RepID=A0A2I0WID6_9ASPA|nr:Putative SWI/SNF-related matrix-associated actin-dependent regulator of chromatin subfamily A member 3-like 1 [Dendrobium catenatum]
MAEVPIVFPTKFIFFAFSDAIPTVQCAIEDGSLHLFTPNDHEFGLSESVIVNESTSTNVSKERRRVDEIFALVGKEGKGIELLEPPKVVILTELFPHQKEGLGWLVHRENSQDLPLFWKEKNGAFLKVLRNHLTNDRLEPLKGGIFGDDMGLGKTLTLLSLIASNKLVSSVSYTLVDDVGTSRARKHKSGNKRVVSSRKKHKIDVDDYNGGFLDRKYKVSSPKTTLVVCPSLVLTTWIAQLEQHTRPGSLQVYLYHAEHKKEVDLLLSHDIVLTAYKTLALEFSSSHSPLKEIEWLRVILD